LTLPALCAWRPLPQHFSDPFQPSLLPPFNFPITLSRSVSLGLSNCVSCFGQECLLTRLILPWGLCIEHIFRLSPVL
jgi:hypothetical protein